MNRSTASGIVFGLFVIVFGVLALLQGVFGFQIGITPGMFWGLVIVAVALSSVVHRGFRFWNVVFLIIGADIVIDALGFFRRNTFIALISLLLVALGIYIIVHAVSHPHFSGNTGGTAYNNSDNSDYVKYDSSFSEINISNVSKCFKGGHVSSAFGTLRLDLSQIDIQENAVLEISVTFGTMEIRLPRNVPYKTDVTPVFGSFINNAPSAFPVAGAPFLEIKGSAVFGTCRLI